jgi:hypothetical protein
LQVKKKNSEESSTQWTTGIAEVQLPIECVLQSLYALIWSKACYDLVECYFRVQLDWNGILKVKTVEVVPNIMMINVLV